MSVSSVLFTVHFEWATNLGPKMFSTLKLKELQCHKTRLRQPLLGATIMLFVERSDDIETECCTFLSRWTLEAFRARW